MPDISRVHPKRFDTKATRPMKEISKMLKTSHSNRFMLSSSTSTVLAALCLFACGADEVGPADSDASAGGTQASTRTSSKSTGTANTGTGRPRSNEGGSPTGNGGRVGATGTGAFNQGGRGFGAAQGGFPQFERGGAPSVQTTAGPTCRGGVQTGSACDPDYDTSECVRSTRTCQCDATTSQWNCTPTLTASGGAGATGGQGSKPSFAGTPGSTNRPSMAGSTQKTGLAGAASISLAGTRN